MDSIEQTLFSPLGKEYCAYFYYLSVFVCLFFIFAVLSGLYIGISSKKGLSYYVKLFVLCFSYLLIYFQNRLLYSMCVN